MLDLRGFEPHRILILRGGISHAHGRFPRESESANLGRDNLSREIWRIVALTNLNNSSTFSPIKPPPVWIDMYCITATVAIVIMVGPSHCAGFLWAPQNQQIHSPASHTWLVNISCWTHLLSVGNAWLIHHMCIQSVFICRA